MLNSIIIGMVDYSDSEDTTFGNRLIKITEPIFTILFTLEIIIKVIARGLIWHKHSYLRDYWNWLDFLVVVTGLIAFAPNVGNFSILRTFRLFRPLRSLSALKSMRTLVNTLLSSVLQLGSILALAMFFFLIFAILGISLWDGLLN